MKKSKNLEEGIIFYSCKDTKQNPFPMPLGIYLWALLCILLFNNFSQGLPFFSCISLQSPLPPYPFWAETPDPLLFFFFLLFLPATTIQVPHASSVNISCLLSDETHKYMVTFTTSGHGFCDESDFFAFTSNRLEFQRFFENNGLPSSY